MASCNSNAPETRMTSHDPIPAQLVALKTTPTPDLKAQWRELFATEPPPFNRRYLESRLAYRMQELAYGGLKPWANSLTVEIAPKAGCVPICAPSRAPG
jgi:hypothetical protein